jgi:hypothetical protein
MKEKKILYVVSVHSKEHDYSYILGMYGSEDAVKTAIDKEPFSEHFEFKVKEIECKKNEN